MARLGARRAYHLLGATLIHLLTGITPADLPQQDLRIQWSDRVSVDPQLIRWINVLTAPDLDPIADIKRVQLIPFTEIRLETWMICYSFGQTLTENERRWLVEELQGWLAKL